MCCVGSMWHHSHKQSSLEEVLRGTVWFLSHVVSIILMMNVYPEQGTTRSQSKGAACILLSLVIWNLQTCSHVNPEPLHHWFKAHRWVTYNFYNQLYHSHYPTDPTQPLFFIDSWILETTTAQPRKGGLDSLTVLVSQGLPEMLHSTTFFAANFIVLAEEFFSCNNCHSDLLEIVQSLWVVF